MAVTIHYILDPDGEPLPCIDFMTWGTWMQTAERHLAKTTVGLFWVSTVFLGIDHAFGGGPPVLWETMIFGPAGHELDQYMDRYRSRETALEGHAEAVAMVLEAFPRLLTAAG